MSLLRRMLGQHAFAFPQQQVQQHSTAVSSASTRSSVASALALTCCSCSALIAGSSAAAWSRDPLAR